MKLPTIRRDETSPSEAGREMTLLEPPLSITVIQTLDDKAQAYILQMRSYGVKKEGKSWTHALIWTWLVAALAFGAIWFDEIKAQGFSRFLAEFDLMSVLPTLILLMAASAVLYLLSRGAEARKRSGYRAHLRRTGEEGERGITIVFDGEGISTRETSGEVRFLPWRPEIAFFEDERWLCLFMPMQEMNIVIPKQQLTPQEIEAVRRWNGLRDKGPVDERPKAQAGLAGREILRTQEFAPEKPELVAAMLEIANAPGWRYRRRKTYLTLALCSVLLMPAFYLVGWLVDPDRLPLALTWPLYLELFATTFWIPAAWGLGAVTALMLAQPWLQRWNAGYFASKMMETGFGRGIAVFGEKGIWNDNLTDRQFLPWPTIRAFRFTDQHILITFRMGAVMAYPKSALPPGTLPEVETLFRERAGKPLTTEGAAA
ncbi:hypothetical protein FHW37_102733 [Neorhizobium alkalisoli]|uniref:YcxB-like protein n=2 Tax=Neorhizobium alkalisoli TaxID=528178 RepID=A0A561R3E7_9HYPH|nr:hypothetical protein FHW37_102733 [Neorhizobium alkalisoli]